MPTTLRGQVTVAIAGSALVPLLGSLFWISAEFVRSDVPMAWSVTLLAVLLLGYIALSVAVGRFLGERLARPLETMADDIRGVRDDQQLAGRLLPVGPGDPQEVRDLKRLLNDLNERVAREVDGRRAVLAMVAHDLKNPVLGTVRVLEQAALGRVSTDAWLDGVLAEQRRLLETVTLLVQAAKFEHGEFRVTRSSFDMRGVVDRVARRTAVASHVAIKCEGAATVFGDEALIERAVTNLVDNAARYARSIVSVDVYPGLVRVADDGPGLPSDLATLSSPFRSESLFVDGVATPGGMAGLGLFIARRILEAHGGRLVVERADGEGTRLLAYVPA